MFSFIPEVAFTFGWWFSLPRRAILIQSTYLFLHLYHVLTVKLGLSKSPEGLISVIFNNKWIVPLSTILKSCLKFNGDLLHSPKLMELNVCFHKWMPFWYLFYLCWKCEILEDNQGHVIDFVQVLQLFLQNVNAEFHKEWHGNIFLSNPYGWIYREWFIRRHYIN